MFSLLYSCNTERCLKSTGRIISVERDPEHFTELEINDVFDVYISQSQEDKIIIEGGEHLIPDIETTVKDKKLVISNNNDCSWLREYKRIKITIYTDSLTTINLNGQSDIYSSDTLKQWIVTIAVNSGISKINLLINCHELHFDLNGGTGEYSFNGKAGLAYFYLMGTGVLLSDSLVTGYNFITSNTTGDCRINAQKLINAQIENRGDIYYKGSPPNIETVISGLGHLIKVD
ncbi:MAG: DUF2807 domain-containing protein [Bacteroidia bacterium]|nr:DUF2807 domain-containing protein [Bacteroidia bacterium]